MDVAEHDVGHGRALGDGDRQREERDAALRIDGAVDRVEDDRDRAVCGRRAMAEFLRDEREVDSGRVQQRHDGLLGCRVDGCRIVAALPAADDQLALVASGQLGEHRLDLGGCCTAERQPVRHRGWKSKPLGSLG